MHRKGLLYTGGRSYLLSDNEDLHSLVLKMYFVYLKGVEGRYRKASENASYSSLRLAARVVIGRENKEYAFRGCIISLLELTLKYRTFLT